MWPVVRQLRQALHQGLVLQVLNAQPLQSQVLKRLAQAKQLAVVATMPAAIAQAGLLR